MLLPQAKLTVSTVTYRQPVSRPITIRNQPPYPVAQATYVDATAKRVELSPEERDAEDARRARATDVGLNRPRG